jgi:hypothetical protein
LSKSDGPRTAYGFGILVDKIMQKAKRNLELKEIYPGSSPKLKKSLENPESGLRFYVFVK